MDYVSSKLPKAIEHCLLDLIRETTILVDLELKESSLRHPAIDQRIEEALNAGSGKSNSG